MIRGFKDGDIEKIDIQEEQLLEGDNDGFNSPNTVVFEEDGKVLVMMCPVYYDGGCIVAGLVSKECKNKSTKLVRQTIRYLRDLKKNNDFVEISTQRGWLNAERLAWMLGFKPDRLLEKMYNGMDFNVWRLK